MKLLRRWLSLRYRLRTRRWRLRAQQAEAEVFRLRLQLAAERDRNMEREDTFASASIMGQRGMWGILPRSGPAGAEKVQAKPASDPFGLTQIEQMEFDTYWKPDAEAAGIGLAQAKQQFFKEVVLPRRQPLNDDPFNRAN
jgi:hypothetical protein